MRQVIALLLLSGHSSACAFGEYAAWEEARSRYEECVAVKGAEDCEAELAEMRQRERDYEGRAVQNWGCENSPDGCGPARGPAPRER